MIHLISANILLFLLLNSLNAKSQDQSLTYIKNVMPIEQKIWHDNNSYEGCGPIAGAMLLGYYETEKNQDFIRSHFDGFKRPSEAIKELYEKLGAKKMPLGKIDGVSQVYTTPGALKSGLKNIVDGSQYTVKSVTYHRTADYKFKRIKHALSTGNPVIALVREIPKCINNKTRKKFSWHYILINGIDTKNNLLYILDGYYGGTKIETNSPSNHYFMSEAPSPIICYISEILTKNTGLFWLEKDL